MKFSRNIMMGDPRYFSIKKGANPHTRDFLGLKRHVDRKKAQAQWDQMTEILTDYGAYIHVLPAEKNLPGLVFPANAGVVLNSEKPKPLSKREYLLAHLSVSRSEEEAIYRQQLNQLGVTTHECRRSFEGEADFIPWGDKYIFTYGKLQRQRWAFRMGIPPWKRIYGFRTEEKAVGEMANYFPAEKIIKAELRREAFYHGDTVLCSFGPSREFLLVYLEGIKEKDRGHFQDHPNVIPLSEKDAKAFAANSFQIIHKGQCTLFLPEGIESILRQHIETKGVQTVTIDVSEFLKKGGGSIKCMIGDLGAWAPEPT